MMRSVLMFLGMAFCMLAPSLADAQSGRQQREQIVSDPTPVAVYMPPSALRARFYSHSLWVEPGKALSDALDEVGKRYFPNSVLVPSDAEAAYALLVHIKPEWDIVRGRLQLKMQYEVYDAEGTALLDADAGQVVPIRAGNFNAAANAVAALVTGDVMRAIQRRVNPGRAGLPDPASIAGIDFPALVDRKKPYRTGTAFFINTEGHLLTAAHVARDCVAIEVHQDGDTFPVTIQAASDLLDVALLASDRPRESALALRQGNELVLGEAVTSVGFPLKGLLGDSPNVTRGNVSASRGIRGSMGMFQFSAPIQPGNSGGPVVSDNGELLGMAVSTLNASRLAERGVIPQNVNFALEGRHVVQFLQREGVPYEEIAPEGDGGLQVANRAALGNTVQLNCYE